MALGYALPISDGAEPNIRAPLLLQSAWLIATGPALMVANRETMQQPWTLRNPADDKKRDHRSLYGLSGFRKAKACASERHMWVAPTFCTVLARSVRCLCGVCAFVCARACVPAFLPHTAHGRPVIWCSAASFVRREITPWDTIFTRPLRRPCGANTSVQSSPWRRQTLQEPPMTGEHGPGDRGPADSGKQSAISSKGAAASSTPKIRKLLKWTDGGRHLMQHSFGFQVDRIYVVHSRCTTFSFPPYTVFTLTHSKVKIR